MKTTSRLLTSAFGLALLGGSSLVRAQAPQASSSPEAKVLFEQAIAEVDRKEWSSACPKLVRAIQMQPTAIGGRLELGRCYEGWEKLASAHEAYVAVDDIPATRPEHAALKRQASESARRLQPKLAMITIHVPVELREAKGFELTLDDVPLKPSQMDAPFAIDKGSHSLVASTNGKKKPPITVKIVADGSQSTVSVLLETAEPAPSGTSAPLETRPASASPSTAIAASPAPSRSRVPGYIGGSLGLAGLVAGAALVGVAISKGADLRGTTPKDEDGNPVCARTAVAGENEACADIRSTADVASTMGNAGVGLLIGGGALVTAAAIYLLIPSSEAASSSTSSRLVPAIGREGGGLVWTGSF